MDVHKVTAAIFAVFFIESAVLGSWIPRIPDVKDALGLSASVLGLCLLALAFGTLLGLLIAGRVIEQLGLRAACKLFLPVWAMLFVLPGFAYSAASLGISLLVCGVAAGLIEVAMNTQADQVETLVGKRIMSRCHGFWSLGSMVGALLGSGFAYIGASVGVHFLLIMPAFALLGWAAASRLPQALPVERIVQKTSLFRLPSRSIVLLCVMPVGIMLVEGAFIDWSAVFMRSVMNASPLVIGITYAFFSIVMALTRFYGDSLASHFGDLVVVRVSSVAATIGIMLFALAPTVPVAVFAAALSGMGVAVIYPLSITAAARRPGGSAADNVAAMTMISFSAFLFAPPIIGFLADAFGLRMALLSLSPFVICTVLLAGEINTTVSPIAASGSDRLI